MSNLLDPHIESALAKDKMLLEQTSIPIVTVSAAFREDLKDFHGLPSDNVTPDVVFSRAHYSMAVAALTAVWGDKVDTKKAWIVDPTNYVSHKDWNSITFTEAVGKTLARYSILKMLKDLVDNFARSKLPILKSITPPLLFLTKDVTQPILSFHIAAGNILAAQGKTVVQVITDPHVRDEYLNFADKSNFYLCVFDEKTKTDVMEKASILDKKIDPNRIIVTGPPIDTRIVEARDKKHPWRTGPLKLCITTGGLGTNKYEIREVLKQLIPELKKRDPKFQVVVYAATQSDICDMVRDLAKQSHLKVKNINSNTKAKISKDDHLVLLYHPQIVDANELLIKYGFPWADGFVTKPSGDMAYDAAAAGSFLLTLKEWGIWEEHISEFFEQKGISRPAETEHFIDQLEALTQTQGKTQSWAERAMHRTSQLDKNFYQGIKNIIKVVKSVKKS